MSLDLGCPPAVERMDFRFASAGIANNADQLGNRAQRVDRVDLQWFRDRLTLDRIQRQQFANHRPALLVADFRNAVLIAPEPLANEPGRYGQTAAPGTINDIQLMPTEEKPRH